PREIGAGGGQGGAGRQPAGEQIGRDLPPPHRWFQHRPAVVGTELVARLGGRLAARLFRTRGGRARADVAGLGVTARFARAFAALRHRRPPVQKTAADAASRAEAATAACFHMDTRSRVGTTGSGGSPYTSGSSSSRKNAPLPPTPSSGSWPYSRASS